MRFDENNNKSFQNVIAVSSRLTLFPSRQNLIFCRKYEMENSTPSPQQTVQINASQAHMIQGATSTPIQIFAQDGGGTGKAFYIIDPSQVTNGLQMISNADQRFELNGSGANTTVTASPQTLSGTQPAQQTVVVSLLTIFTVKLASKMAPKNFHFAPPLIFYLRYRFFFYLI